MVDPADGGCARWSRVEITWTIFVLFAAALAAPVLHRWAPRVSGLVLSCICLGVFLWFFHLSTVVLSVDYVAEAYGWWRRLDGVWSFHVDAFSLLLALLITFNGALNAHFAHGYLTLEEVEEAEQEAAEGHPRPGKHARAETGRFLALLLSLVACMLGLVLSDHLLMMVIFWEASGLVTFGLIGFKGNTEARRQATQMLMIDAIGVAALLVAVWLLKEAGGSYLLSELIHQGDVLRAAPTYPWMLGLVMVAVATKSCLFPFHFWLRGTVLSPTPASAAVGMVKAGVFLLGRFHPMLGNTEAWMWTLVGLGSLTMMWSSITGLFERHAKRIVVSLTVAAMGMITMLFGLENDYAVKTAILLLVGQIIYKTALYISIGVITHRTSGEYDVSRTGNLYHWFPITATAAMMAAVSKVGIYPFFGSIKKAGLMEALMYEVDFALFLVVPAMVTSMLMLVLTLSVGWHPFLARGPAWLRRCIVPGGDDGEASAPYPTTAKSQERREHRLTDHGHQPTLSMTAPLVVLGVAGLTLGLFPTFFLEPWVVPATENVLGRPVEVSVFGDKKWGEIKTLLGFITIFLGLLLFFGRADLWRWSRRYLQKGSYSERAFRAGAAALQDFAAHYVRFGQRVLSSRWALIGIVATLTTALLLR